LVFLNAGHRSHAGNYVHVTNYVAKAEQTPDVSDPLILAKLRSAAGLVRPSSPPNLCASLLPAQSLCVPQRARSVKHSRVTSLDARVDGEAELLGRPPGQYRILAASRAPPRGPRPLWRKAWGNPSSNSLYRKERREHSSQTKPSNPNRNSTAGEGG
jgi:hypothetical protein